ASLALVVLNAAIVGVAGRLAFGTTGAALWLGGMASGPAAAALRRPAGPTPTETPTPTLRPRAISPTFRHLLLAVAVVLADVALGLLVHGLALTAAWGAPALGFRWLVRGAQAGA